MKDFVKNLIKNGAIGIGFSFAIFCFTGVVFDFLYHGNFQLEQYAFTKMVLGCLIVGIGFGCPTVIYDCEQLPLPVQSVIHMGIGCIVYTIVAFLVGWIPVERGVGTCVAIVLGEIAIAFVIWFCYLLYYRNLGRKMDARIQQIKKE